MIMYHDMLRGGGGLVLITVDYGGEGGGVQIAKILISCNM